MIERRFGNELLHDLTFRVDRRRMKGMIILDKSLERYPSDFVESKVKVIGGHFTVNKYDYLKWPNVTFLRHPVERVVAYYSVWRSRRNWDPFGIKGFAERCPNYMHFMTAGNLDRFEVVGLVSRFEESIRLLEKKMKFHFNYHIPKLNQIQRKYKARPHKSTLQYIRELNYLDMELYEEAVRRFESDQS